MPITVTPPPAPPSHAVEIEDGVIEEARQRQRRRRAAGLALGVSAVVVAISVLLIGGGGSNSPAPDELLSGAPPKLTLPHGRALIDGRPALIGVEPSLQAGNVGVCITIAGEGGTCNGPPPTVADPVYGGAGGVSIEEKVGPRGEIDALFTGPRVAAVRVAHLGTFHARPAPGLSHGSKEIIFYRPPGSRGSVLPPGTDPRALQGFEHARQGPALAETLLDSSGRPITVSHASTFELSNSYWAGAQSPPARGRCAMSSSLPGVRTQWGQVADRIAADPSITVPAWLTCLHVWFSAAGASYETAVLLNARYPGKPPAMLWGARPVSGHPGLVEIPPVQREIHFRYPQLSRTQVAQELAEDTKTLGRARAEQYVRQAQQVSDKEQTRWEVLVPPTVARRVGPAWLLVRYGASLAQRIAFLRALDVTKIELPHLSARVTDG